MVRFFKSCTHFVHILLLVAGVGHFSIRDIVAEEPLTSMYKRCSESVVVVEVENEDGVRIGQGSGFFVNPEEAPAAEFAINKLKQRRSKDSRWNRWHTLLVVTNFHVIEGAVNASVVSANGDRGHVHVVLMEDELDDLAVLLVTMPFERKPSVLEINVGTVEIGSKIFAIGSPKGQSQFLSDGIIGGQKANTETGSVDLLHTVPVSSGSSGSPLLNADGDVIGVVKATVVGSQNLNVASPSTALSKLLKNQDGLRLIGDARTTSIYIELIENRVRIAAAESTARSEHSKALKKMLAASKFLRTEEDPLKAWDLVHQIKQDVPPQFHFYWHYLMGLANEQISMQSDDKKGLQAAINEYLSAIEQDPDFSPTLDGMCRVCSKLEDWNNVLWMSRILEKHMPFYATAYRHEGLALWKLSELSESRLALKRAIELDPKNQKTCQLLGNVLCEFGEFEAAATSYLSGNTNDDSHRAEQIWLAGGALKEGGQYLQAMTVYENALKFSFDQHDPGLGEVFQSMCAKGIEECRQRLSVK